MMNYVNNYESPLGTIILAGNDKGLTGLWFEGQKYFGSTLGEEYEEKDIPVFLQAREWLDTYFQGKEPKTAVPLSLTGSPFRMSVWKILMEIPYGQVTTYGQIAEKLARQQGLSSMSPQAVGGAVGHNPISIIIPCHRVVGSDGSLTGYAGGVEKKRKLLELEGFYFKPYPGGK